MPCNIVEASETRSCSDDVNDFVGNCDVEREGKMNESASYLGLSGIRFLALCFATTPCDGIRACVCVGTSGARSIIHTLS